MHELHLLEGCQFKDWSAFTSRGYAFEACTDAAVIFEANMERANGILRMPGHAFRSGGEWHTCANMAARHVFGDELPSEQELSELHQTVVAFASQARVDALAKETIESRVATFRTACKNIEFFSFEYQALNDWLHAVLQSAILQAWTAFEVLSEDLHINSRDKHSVCFDPANVSAKGYNFRRRSGIRDSYKKAFCEDATINDIVDSKEVKALNLLRNLFVHKNGIVDSKFIKECSENPVVM